MLLYQSLPSVGEPGSAMAVKLSAPPPVVETEPNVPTGADTAVLAATVVGVIAPGDRTYAVVATLVELSPGDWVTAVLGP